MENTAVIEAPTPELAPGGAGELERTTARLFQVVSQDLGRAYDLLDRIIGLFERSADHILPAITQRLGREGDAQLQRVMLEVERSRSENRLREAQAAKAEAEARKIDAEIADIQIDIEHRRHEAGLAAQPPEGY